MADEDNRDQPTGTPEPTDQVSAEELAELRKKAAQADDLREQVLRAKADYANLQKRVEREAKDRRRFIVKEVIGALLPALDDLLLLRIANAAPEVPVRQGVEMALNKLDQALRGLGIERIPTVGQPFDPAVHEALATEVRKDAKRPTVVEEVGAGYRAGDLVIRPARVTVAVPPTDESSPSADAEE